MGARAAEEACRAAVSADVPRLAELAAAAIAELSSGRGGAVWARTQARRAPFEPALEAAIAADDHHVVVGSLDGVVLGYGVARVEVLADGGRLGVVDDLYTEPDGRELGIGELVMGALVDWCRQQGCFGVDSLALPGDRHTKNFFESFGLVARAIIVHRSLP
ncbi:MAG TPA: GNAT family N-acetyltransferase [Acidimicrobiales bacterium]|nr:GNAT family N-acetyltransferase [Acidimicrobiales bacterium]